MGRLLPVIWHKETLRTLFTNVEVRPCFRQSLCPHGDSQITMHIGMAVDVTAVLLTPQATQESQGHCEKVTMRLGKSMESSEGLTLFHE
jgi:hypothetical protein